MPLYIEIPEGEDITDIGVRRVTNVRERLVELVLHDGVRRQYKIVPVNTPPIRSAWTRDPEDKILISEATLVARIEGGKVRPIIVGFSGSLSIAVGLVSGFLWMSVGDDITSESSMALLVLFGTMAVYFPLEMSFFLWEQHRWPTVRERRLIMNDTSELGLKTLASICGWMAGADWSSRLKLGNLASTLMVAFSDAFSVGIISAWLEAGKGYTDTGSPTWDIASVIVLSALSAAAWKQLYESRFTTSSSIKGAVVAAVTGVTWYVGDKWMPSLFNGVKRCLGYGNPPPRNPRAFGYTGDTVSPLIKALPPYKSAVPSAPPADPEKVEIGGPHYPGTR